MQILLDKREPKYLIELDGKDIVEIHTRESFLDHYKGTDWVLTQSNCKRWEYDLSPIEWIDLRHNYEHNDFHMGDTYMWGGLMINRII